MLEVIVIDDGKSFFGQDRKIASGKAFDFDEYIKKTYGVKK